MRFIEDADIGDDAAQREFNKYRRRIELRIWAVILPVLWLTSARMVWWGMHWYGGSLSIQDQNRLDGEALHFAAVLFGVFGLVANTITMVVMAGDGESPYNAILGFIGRSWVTLLWKLYSRNKPRPTTAATPPRGDWTGN